MRILLLGRTGQVGWELERTLAPLGRIVALGRAELDLTEVDRIAGAVSRAEPDLIVNAAAYTAVDRAESEPEFAHVVNGVAPGVLAAEAVRHGAALIHFSTDYVFDGTRTGPYDEEAPPRPLSVYGRSKLQGEEAIRTSGAPHLLLRTSWVYGNRGRNFLNTMIRLIREREALRVVDDQVGAPTWGRMVAEAVAAVVARLVGSSQPIAVAMTEASGTYHLTASGETSWHGFARAIHRRMLKAAPNGVRARVIEAIGSNEYPAPARRPANSLLANDKVRTAFGIELPGWEEQLDLCLTERFEKESQTG